VTFVLNYLEGGDELFAAIPLGHRDGVVALHAILEVQVLQALLHQEGFDLNCGQKKTRTRRVFLCFGVV
jgi:hypothetical protein